MAETASSKTRKTGTKTSKTATAARVSDEAASRPRAGEQTRASLLAVARQEFAAKGFAGTRVDEIADAAGVNKQVIYHHFGSKDGLFRTTLELGYEQVVVTNEAYVANLAPMDPPKALRHLIENMFDRFHKHPEMVELVLEENRQRGRHLSRRELVAKANRPLLDHVARLIAEGEAQGCFLPGNDSRQFFVDMVSLCMFFFSNVHTMSAALSENLGSAAQVKKRRNHIVHQLLRGLGWRGAEPG